MSVTLTVGLVESIILLKSLRSYRDRYITLETWLLKEEVN